MSFAMADAYPPDTLPLLHCRITSGSSTLPWPTLLMCCDTCPPLLRDGDGDCGACCGRCCPSLAEATAALPLPLPLPLPPSLPAFAGSANAGAPRLTVGKEAAALSPCLARSEALPLPLLAALMRAPGVVLAKGLWNMP